MTQINKSVATLRLYGDDLIPSEVTSLLKCSPSHEQQKGQVIIGKNLRLNRVVNVGMWRKKASDFMPENIDSQIVEIIEQMTPDLDVWQSLSKKYGIDMFCGLFMEENNEGFDISVSSLKLLSERGISIGFDIYAQDEVEIEGNV